MVYVKYFIKSCNKNIQSTQRRSILAATDKFSESDSKS